MALQVLNSAPETENPLIQQAGSQAPLSSIQAQPAQTNQPVATGALQAAIKDPIQEIKNWWSANEGKGTQADLDKWLATSGYTSAQINQALPQLGVADLNTAIRTAKQNYETAQRQAWREEAAKQNPVGGFLISADPGQPRQEPAFNPYSAVPTQELSLAKSALDPKVANYADWYINQINPMTNQRNLDIFLSQGVNPYSSIQNQYQEAASRAEGRKAIDASYVAPWEQPDWREKQKAEEAEIAKRNQESLAAAAGSPFSTGPGQGVSQPSIYEKPLTPSALTDVSGAQWKPASAFDSAIEEGKTTGNYAKLSSVISGLSDSQISQMTGKSQDEVTNMRQMASSKPFNADEFRSSWDKAESSGDYTGINKMVSGISDAGLMQLMGASVDDVKYIRRRAQEAQKKENADTVTQQILGQNTTAKWSGQGFGSPEENSRAIANYFQGAGVSDIKQIGMRPELQQAYLLGYQTQNGDKVYKQQDGSMFYYAPDANGDLSPKILTPEEEKNVKPIYGKTSDGFLDVETPVGEDQLVEKDGEKYYKTGRAELYNKDTGQAISTDIRYPGGWVHNVLDEAEPNFTGVEPGKPYIFGRTFAGDGSTNFNVVFDQNGDPYFYTTYGGSTSTSFSDVAPFLAIAALPFLLPAAGIGAGAGAAGAGAAGAGAMTAAELGASFAADMAAAGYAGTAAAGAGAAAAAEVAAGAAGAGAGTAAAATGTAAATGAASTSIATKIGMSLGLEGMSATMAGNALINGTISELTGGDFVKGAVSGALLSPGVTASVGALATEGLSKIGVDWYLNSAAQKALGTALVSATLSGGDLNKAAKAALTSYVGDAIVNSPKFDQYLKDAGIKGIANEAVRSAIGGATISAIRGDNPLTGALTSGAATAIGSLTKGYLEDSKLSKQAANALSKATATFVANKLAGANDQQAFVAAAMAGGSAGIARTAVRDINKIPVETLGSSSNIRSETNPDDLASVYAERTGKTEYGPAGLALASASGELPAKAEISGKPVFAESSEEARAKISVPPGYRLMSVNDEVVTPYGNDRVKVTRPSGAYYDALQNAWMTPSGEFDLGGIQDFSGLFGPESQSAGVSPITDNALKAYADAIKAGASEEDAFAAANAVSRGDEKGSGTSQVDINSPEMVITAPREPVEPIVPEKPNLGDQGEIVVTAPREPVEPNVPEVPATPSTPTTPKTPTTPTTPMVPVTPMVPTVPTTPSGGGGSFGGAGSGSSTGQEKTLALAATSLISKIINDKTIDPLEKVKLIQQEMEKEQMMQNLDPRLAAILSEQFGVQPAQQEQQAAPYYAYGQEQSIDDILGNSAPQYASGGYVAPLMAQGGMALPLLAKSGGALDQYAGRENFKDGKHVAGEGDGQSDDIPAWLADGEFVFPADVVSALGNGSTKAGTDKLYEMMHSIRERARSKDPEDLPPPALKSPLDYLKSHKRSK